MARYKDKFIQAHAALKGLLPYVEGNEEAQPYVNALKEVIFGPAPPPPRPPGRPPAQTTSQAQIRRSEEKFIVTDSDGESYVIQGWDNLVDFCGLKENHIRVLFCQTGNHLRRVFNGQQVEIIRHKYHPDVPLPVTDLPVAAHG